jgi:hypothetical protein
MQFPRVVSLFTFLYSRESKAKGTQVARLVREECLSRLKLRATAMATAGATPPSTLELLRLALPRLAALLAFGAAAGKRSNHVRRRHGRGEATDPCRRCRGREGELLPPGWVHARWGARASCFLDFLCCNCCIPMLAQCCRHVAIVRLQAFMFCKSLSTCSICVFDTLQVSHANVSKLDINFSKFRCCR